MSLEDSPPGIAQNLERVLEILRSSELYSPYFNNPMIKGDQMTTDLVGGLITMVSVTMSSCDYAKVFCLFRLTYLCWCQPVVAAALCRRAFFSCTWGHLYIVAALIFLTEPSRKQVTQRIKKAHLNVPRCLSFLRDQCLSKHSACTCLLWSSFCRAEGSDLEYANVWAMG